jgi:hypothetical protein
MPVFTFAIVVIAALFAISSGVWVAIALIRAISRNRTAQTKYSRPESDANGPDV